MNVFLAGGSGAIGVALVRQLITGGHQVTALTRSSANADMLRQFGATPALADALGAPPPIAVPLWLRRLVSPCLARVLAIRLPLSNARARAELGWRPTYPNIRAGLSQTLRRAA